MAFSLVGSWQLRRWLRSQSAALGCSLEYAPATAVIPNTFQLRSAQLSACSQGRWDVRVVRSSGKVLLRSMVWGPIQPTHVELELDSLRVGGAALDGTVLVNIERRVDTVHAQARATKLTLRRGAQRLATTSHGRLDLEIPPGASAPRSFARFTLQSLAMGVQFANESNVILNPAGDWLQSAM